MAEKTSTKKAEGRYAYAYGRRKGAIASVRLFEGKGIDMINGKEAKKVYSSPRHQRVLYLPFTATDTKGKYYFTAQIKGGGVAGRLGAIKLAISRAMIKIDQEFRPTLKKLKLLIVDSRVKERKKPGLKKARKKEQYSKR
ncbi:MAG: 30S ribosomal protein S9 [Candidatus Dojkabacteria bacterium]|nr:30S ribosomal protein S9 [Candidatus Dojkabacteria bacterium]